MPVDHRNSRLSRRTATKRRKRPMTQAERNALTFPGIPNVFDWGNEEWGLRWLLWVRLAVLMVRDDDVETTKRMAEIVESGLAGGLLDQLSATSEHLAKLQTVLDQARTRSYLALERLGYTPDNPPPGFE
jgi:hypothetical protein